MLNRFLLNIRRHPLLSFFLITFTTSWFFLILAYGVFKNSMFLAWVGMFFPSLTALFITGVCDKKSGLERILSRLFHWQVPGAGIWQYSACPSRLSVELFSSTTVRQR